MGGWTTIVFEVQRDGNPFRDALHLPVDHGFTDAEIETMKEERYLNWVAQITPTLRETGG